MSNVDNPATNIYGLAVSAIGVFGVVPLIWACVRSQLPTTKLRELDETLTDTESLLRSVVEEGLLDPTQHVPHFQVAIQTFRSATEHFREETYMATDLSKQLAAWFDGLSRRISVLCAQVKKVRASICETSVEARMQLMQQHPFAPPPVRLSRWARMRAALRRLLCCVRTRSKTADPATAQSCAPEGDCIALSHLSATSPESPECYDVDTKPVRQTRTPRDHKSRMRALVRAIRRVDKDLESQGVTHPVLKQVVQATNQLRPSVCRKPSHMRRSRRSHSLLFYPSTVVQTVVLPQACESGDDSDEDSWEEETVCDKEECVS
ncbi:hypothetical protein L226DRAFT_536640 [Lentinus tigrinus ALCF2SS1-7]|uniref:Uncharacterized protein n=1 Tax=Lentinus tigrinus ALCF2SS1-6 TaxID=1328759 RepID=A0A5C2S196_9APHY|nr:hypothetical protein L227DRAFT_578110 [Lentinus tigrinus ALCF2SS1-6]RPD73148.1 hypothetical protein L226DRAFT_536640 [Lentinus tigrinus ALCF2SS1-7]